MKRVYTPKESTEKNTTIVLIYQGLVLNCHNIEIESRISRKKFRDNTIFFVFFFIFDDKKSIAYVNVIWSNLMHVTEI
jgi:hypothetical protein